MDIWHSAPKDVEFATAPRATKSLYFPFLGFSKSRNRSQKKTAQRREKSFPFRCLVALSHRVRPPRLFPETAILLAAPGIDGASLENKILG